MLCFCIEVEKSVLEFECRGIEMSLRSPEHSSLETQNNHETVEQRTKAGKARHVHSHHRPFSFFQKGRTRHFRMSECSQNGGAHNGVQLKGFTDKQNEDVDMTLQEAINGEDGRKEAIVGPTGTVRGIKNIIKQRTDAYLYSAAHGNSRILEESTDDSTGKIIIYTTSMGGIRSTVHECRYVKKIFDNLNLETDERDIFLHKEFQIELDQRLHMVKAAVPQVFVNGVCIGGKEELIHLNDTGQLKELLSGFKKLDGSVCQRCGGFRYVNCPSCNGSKRVRPMRMNREITGLRCTKCNENGLQRCPDCCAK